MLTTILIATAAAVGGALVNGKLILPALHKRPAGPIRDALLKTFNGGAGPRPQ